MESRVPEKLFLAAETRTFLEKFFSSVSMPENLGSENEKSVGTAWLYEKIRVALEYQEEHLVFKNAIARILRRQYTLSIRKSSSQLVSDLISELSWANYINPELVTSKTTERIEALVDRYLSLLSAVKSGRFQRHEVQKLIIDWLACEIDEVFYSARESDVMLDYAYSLIKEHLDISGSKITEEENAIQLRISIYTQLFKPDLAKIQFFVLREVYPEWPKLSADELKKIGRSFDPYFNKIDREVNHPFRKKYLAYVKRNIAPFILLRTVLLSGQISVEKIAGNPALLVNLIMEAYNQAIEQGRQKVWRGTFRALIFILLTKMSLAFIVEMPFDRFFAGAVDYLSLAINVSLPPLLMFIAGTFVKSPPQKNYQLVLESTREIISQSKVESRTYSLAEKKPLKSFFAFNILYSIFTLGVLYGVIWLLLLLHFNIVSILLFFFFVSVVSFFSFRIRNIALELAMKRSKDDALTSAFELAFLPFIRIGKYVSERFTRFNPFILALDFLIEAPLKTIIRIANSWLRFINAKKEELEY